MKTIKHHQPSSIASRRASRIACARSFPSAFTLIELLVVVAVIAVLAALLLPALTRAKMLAQRTNCLSNFKQWGLAMQMYVDENESVIPRESAVSPGTALNLWMDARNPAASNVWYNALPPYLDHQTASNYFPFAKRPSFYEAASFFHCPTAKPKNDTSFYIYFSMAMNSKLIRSGRLVNLDELCHPESTVMFLDNRLDGEPTVVQGMMGENLGQPSAYANRFSIRHGGTGNIIFWDGRAESLRGTKIVDTTVGPHYGQAIEPQRDIVWDVCPP